MKLLFIVAICFAAVVAAPQKSRPETISLRSDIGKLGVGEFNTAYETSDGTKSESQGQLVNGAIVLRGAYSFVGEDGLTYTVEYTADKNGFHPKGAHLPIPAQ